MAELRKRIYIDKVDINSDSIRDFGKSCWR